MNKFLISLIGLIAFYSISWAENDTTKTEILNQPMVRTIIIKEVVIPKDPLLAGLLSAQMPGIGQMYCGKWLKGGLFLISTAVLYGIANECAQEADNESLTEEERDQKAATAIGAFLVGLGIHCWNIFDAHKTAQVHNIKMMELGTGMNQWNIGIANQHKKVSLYISKNL